MAELKLKKNHQESEANWHLLARRLLVSAGLGFALLAVLICIAAAAALRLDIPRERMGLVAIPLAGLAAFASGYLNVRPARRQGLAFGMLAAAALYLPVLALSLAISREGPGAAAVLLLLAMLLCGAAGGITAANRSGGSSRSTLSGHGGKARKR